MKLLRALIDMIYPPRCVICGAVLYHPGYCKRCEGKMEKIEGERCFSCGLPVKSCECKYHIFHFDGIVAPYFNEGFAKDAIYSLKFGGRFAAVEPIADEMADLAIKTFGKENIDLICFVPANKRSLYTRGFNQCELLAKRISEQTGIPLNKRVLAKKEDTKTQHDIKKIEDRYMNVRGAYYYTERIKGKNVLIVDDIKTTGASLDECARQLKFAGAEQVLCVTALISSLKKKPNS